MRVNFKVLLSSSSEPSGAAELSVCWLCASSCAGGRYATPAAHLPEREGIRSPNGAGCIWGTLENVELWEAPQLLTTAEALLSCW